MTQQKKHLSLDETKDVYEWAKSTLEDLVKFKSNDGKIDRAEWLRAAIGNAPAAAKAVIGSGKIADEMKDRDAKENEMLGRWFFELIQLMSELFMGIEKPKPTKPGKGLDSKTTSKKD